MPPTFISYVDLDILTCFIEMHRLLPPHASWLISLRLSSALANHNSMVTWKVCKVGTYERHRTAEWKLISHLSIISDDDAQTMCLVGAFAIPCKRPWIEFMGHRRSINCPLIITLNPKTTRIYAMIEGKLVLIDVDEWFDFTDSGEDDVAAVKCSFHVSSI